MRKHVMAMTYPPKIDPVWAGDCTQTIRGGDKVSEGDSILFHTWEGVPYRPKSKWGWRLRVTVTEAVPAYISWNDGIMFTSGAIWRWGDKLTNELAARDYIVPPTGFALRDVLSDLNGAVDGMHQIIRWQRPEGLIKG